MLKLLLDTAVDFNSRTQVGGERVGGGWETSLPVDPKVPVWIPVSFFERSKQSTMKSVVNVGMVDHPQHLWEGVLSTEQMGYSI